MSANGIATVKLRGSLSASNRSVIWRFLVVAVWLIRFGTCCSRVVAVDYIFGMAIPRVVAVGYTLGLAVTGVAAVRCTLGLAVPGVAAVGYTLGLAVPGVVVVAYISRVTGLKAKGVYIVT